MKPPHPEGQPIQAQLSLWDAISIIVGIVIGSSIFKTAPFIMSNVRDPWMGLGVWALGGLLSIVGAFCYAELATTYPRSGGDYVYLTRAFGPLVGFLFGWAQLSVILTSSIGMMAFVFADYTVTLFELDASVAVWLAIAAVAALTATNIAGVVIGKWTQNILTLAKVLGLGGIIASGFLWGSPHSFDVKPSENWNFGVAMILVLYAYGGWNDAAFVAAELKRRRNIALALILGTVGITIIYLAVNAAYLFSLGFEGTRNSSAIAAEVLTLRLGGFGGKAMCILVMISALGAINGLTFAGARVYATLGADYSAFAALGRWHPRLGTPIYALLVQALISLAMIYLVGTESGRYYVDEALRGASLSPLPWDKYFGGFDTLFAATAPVFWSFFLLTGFALFHLRLNDTAVERPFSLPVPFFPLLPLIFCLMCVFGLYSSVGYAGTLTMMGAMPLVVGLPLYAVSRRNGGRLTFPQE